MLNSIYHIDIIWNTHFWIESDEVLRFCHYECNLVIDIT